MEAFYFETNSPSMDGGSGIRNNKESRFVRRLVIGFVCGN